jgi:hypothetical protein
MSTASFPHALQQHLIAAAVQRQSKPRSASRTHIIRRRPTMQQGMALQTLGHAIEYLVDSRLYRTGEAQAAADIQASQILMGLNRQVFAECREIVPFGRALKLWLAKLLAV